MNNVSCLLYQRWLIRFGRYTFTMFVFHLIIDILDVNTYILYLGTTTQTALFDREMIFSNWVEQGNLLYIPRGFIAFAKTTDQPSVHVVVRISNKNNSFGAMVKKVFNLFFLLHLAIKFSI